jgi:long-chain fatty acid transport protein
VRFRAGYTYAENITRDIPGTDVGGIIPPNALAGVQYIQAQFPAINQHRISGGIGVRDVLPGVDIDLMAGGMFYASEAYGLTSASVASYWVGTGLTWRFGRGSCCPLPVPNDWN